MYTWLATPTHHSLHIVDLPYWSTATSSLANTSTLIGVIGRVTVGKAVMRLLHYDETFFWKVDPQIMSGANTHYQLIHKGIQYVIIEPVLINCSSEKSHSTKLQKPKQVMLSSNNC